MNMLSISSSSNIVFVVLSVVAASLGIFGKILKMTDTSKKNISKTIRKLLYSDIDVSVHKYKYYILLIISYIFAMISYISFGIFAFITSISSKLNYEYPFIMTLIFLGLFIFFFLYSIWIRNHSHFIKNDCFPVYEFQNNLFIILRIINKRALVVRLDHKSDTKDKESKLISIDDKDKRYIISIYTLQKCHIYYIANYVNSEN